MYAAAGHLSFYLKRKMHTTECERVPWVLVGVVGARAAVTINHRLGG